LILPTFNAMRSEVKAVRDDHYMVPYFDLFTPAGDFAA